MFVCHTPTSIKDCAGSPEGSVPAYDAKNLEDVQKWYELDQTSPSLSIRACPPPPGLNDSGKRPPIFTGV